MIERKIVDEKLQEYLVEDFIRDTLNRVGHSHTELHKTPVGEKIIIHASRPGLIVGSKGSNIKKLTKVLKTKFKLENPVIEINEIKTPQLDANLVAENIAFQLERFGSQRFKGIGYSSMDAAIRSGAKGIEILISGKLPASRARTWRFYMGYLKKCGNLAVDGVDTSYTQARLKTGVVGIQVRIMHPDLELPDAVGLHASIEEVKDESDESEAKPVERPSEEVAQAKKESEEIKKEDAKEKTDEKKAETEAKLESEESKKADVKKAPVEKKVEEPKKTGAEKVKTEPVKEAKE